LGACNKAPDGVSVLLTLEEYEELLSRTDGDGAITILDDDVPFGEFSGGADNAAGGYIKLVLDLLNIERETEGLTPLSGGHAGLDEAAAARAEEITEQFSHTRPNGLPCFDALSEYNIIYRAAGENIAKGQTAPGEVVKAWMNSKGHRANILNGNYLHAGIGVAVDQGGTLHWVLLLTN